MTAGRLVIELFEDVAPAAARHLLTRCTPGAGASVQGTLFHKLLPGFGLFGGKRWGTQGGMDAAVRKYTGGGAFDGLCAGSLQCGQRAAWDCMQGGRLCRTEVPSNNPLQQMQVTWLLLFYCAAAAVCTCAVLLPCSQVARQSPPTTG